MVDKKEISAPKNDVDFRVTVVSHELVPNENYAIYVIKVLGPRDITFHLKDRYSSIREFQAMVKRQIGSADGTPTFPKKKLWGNTDAAFLAQRAQHISVFLQVFLAHPLVKTCPLVPVYFRSKAMDNNSKEAIQNLIAYMNG